MITADALSRLYSKHVLCADGNPNWPMLIMGNLQKVFPPGTSMYIQERVLKNKHMFKNVYGTLHQILSNGDTIPYVLSTQKIDKILQYHRDLGHTCSRNLHEYLKTRYWWPNMIDDIREVLEQCKVCEKYTQTKAPPKSSVPVFITQPFKAWLLDIVGPMPGENKGKKYIIAAINYETRWPLLQATKEHKGNDVRKFIRKEIIAKFGKPDLLITDDGTKLKSIDTNIYLAKNEIKHITASPYHPQEKWTSRTTKWHACRSPQ